MFQSFKLLVFYALLLSLVQSLTSFEPKKILFSQGEIEYKSNELKNYTETIDILVNPIDNQAILIGKEGTLCLKAEYNDTKSDIFDPKTIEEETSFQIHVIDEYNRSMSPTCRLWISSERLNLFCNYYFHEIGNHSITIEDQSFEYKNKYLINIVFTGGKKFNIEQSGMEIPFLYSDEQNINLNLGLDSYELKFKINEYNKEILYIYGTKYNYAVLENCTINLKELACEISKEKIEEILILENEKFKIGAINDTLGLVQFDYVSDININSGNISKKDINIKLKKLVGPITEAGTPFAFETDVINMPSFTSDLINNIFYFKKMSGKPLMVFVKYPYFRENITIPSYQNDTIFSNLHYKYNFIIEPFNFNETISVKNNGTNVLLAYPENINFTSINQNATIRYIMLEPSLATDIKLNPDAKSSLECKNLNGLKKCNIPASHFKGKESGLYNTYHKNHLNDSNIYYNAPLIDVSLNIQDENDTIFYIDYDDNAYKKNKIGYKGVINLVINYNDNETNFFNASDIEEKTAFNTSILIDNNSTYNVICKLWKPIDEKLNMFCKFNEILDFGWHHFNINPSSFNYNGKKYNIITRTNSLILQQYNESIPFLYSGKQILKINDNIDTYYLKYKIVEYHNETLFVLSNNNYIILDNCTVKGNELECKLDKEEIEQYTSNEEQELKLYRYLNNSNEEGMSANFCDSDYGVYLDYPLNKTDVYVRITQLLEKNIDNYNYIPYETNVTEIGKVHSNKFFLTLKNRKNISCIFKKTEVIPNLLMLCQVSETNFSLEEIDKEVELRDINIKYNFFIQPSFDNDTCIIKGNGTYLWFTIPKVLDFTLQPEFTIEYAMYTPELIKGIKLNPEGDDLVCNDYKEIIKRCIVNIDHFKDKQSGYYYTYHRNHLNEYIKFYDGTPIKVILPKEEKITEFYIENDDNLNRIGIGYEGIIYFVINYNDNVSNIFNASDIEEKTNFNTTISVNNGNMTNVNCKLWKPIDEKLNLFCKLDKNLTSGLHSIKLSPSTFYYNNQKIRIIQKVESLSLYQYNEIIPFLYSSKQTLKIQENIRTYELKFKIGEYHNESLYYLGKDFDALIIDKCSIKGKELICNIDKTEIEEFATANGQQLNLFHIMPNNTDKMLNLNTIHNIYIDYPLTKTDIYVGITKLNESYIDTNLIVYETNVTNITNVNSERFYINLPKENETEISCHLKKTVGIPLVMFCHVTENEFILGEISNETILNNINIKYNFRIQPINNKEKCSVLGNNAHVLFTTHKLLDFTKRSQFSIYYIMEHSTLIRGIKLNPEADDLYCEDINNTMKKCIVTEDHFSNKKSGYYYTYHTNQVNKSIIFFETSPINIIISENSDIHINIRKEDNEDKIKIGYKGVFALVTNYNDKYIKVFGDDYYNIKFDGNLRDSSGKNKYNVNCKLFVPKDDNLRIICQFNEFLSNETLHLYLDKFNLVYNNRTIYFEQNEDIIFERYYDFIPFLYSDRQTINVNDNITTYELKFKIETYNKNILYIEGSNDNYAILENCQIKDATDELLCPITKETIEKILVNKNEQFKIGAMNDTVGLIPFEHVLNITVNYENVQKKDIFIEIKGIIDGITDLGTPLAFSTNITDIPEFTSGKFKDKIYFKKIFGKPLMIFYYYPEELDDYIKINENKQTVINDLHYKYNFIIAPPRLEAKISIRGNGTNILLTYPLELNYTSENRLPIRYIMKEPRLSNNIKLNPNSKYALECENLNKMKICYVPMAHFTGKKSDVYNTYYLNHINSSSIYYNSPSINVTLPYNIVEININQEDNEDEIHVGDKGMFYLKTNYNDKEENIFSDINIEEKTKFTTSIITEERSFDNIKCHLWKNSKGIIYVFCTLNENLEYDHQNINIKGGNFIYDKYIINIVSKLDHVYTEQLYFPMPFLYAKNQTINIKENEDTYYLKFFIGCYYDEKLFMLGDGVEHIIFDKCSVEKNEIICKLTKTELEEISYNKIKFYAYYPHIGIVMLSFPMVEDIDIKYTLPKIDLNIKVTKLVENYFDLNNFFAYEVESNVENITNLMTEMFNATFEDENKNETEGLCFFKKVNDNPLYLLCKVDKEVHINYLIIKEELKLNKIHIKYNFNIAPIQFEGKINIQMEGSYGIMTMEKTLDFYNNDEFTVDFIFENGKNINYMTFGPKMEELKCKDVYSEIKSCVIPKTYFEKKTSGYYYLYHLNHNKEFIKFYELSPIQVILPKNNEVILRIQKENNKNGVKIGKNGIFALTTSFDEKEKKEIFNNTDIKVIEEKKISAKIKDDNNNEYKAICRLWVPKEDKIRIICKLEENLKNKKQKIILEQISFDYLEYEITIKQIDYIEANQYNYDIPFLYSERDIININLNESNYILKFNIESYNNELLYIYGDALNYDILDNCKADNKELTCTISLKKIEGILTLNETTFKVGAMHDNIGIIPLDNILSINIIYPKIEKENVIIDSFNVINSNTEMGVYFGFVNTFNELNDMSINSIQIDLGLKCYFRKKGKNPLMLLCLSNEEGEFEFPTVPKDIIYEREHYKYNFIIRAYSNIYKFKIKGSGTDIKLTYPEELNFNSTDSLTIRYIMTNPSLAKNIKLNPASSDLTCEDLEGMKKCIINKDHFIGNQTGSFRTLHSNNLGELTSYYESSNISVILPKEEIVEILVSDKDNNYEINIGDKGIIYFITEYKDEQNIFNAEDIVEQTEFITSIIDKNLNNYNVTCRLWKPVDKNMRIFCKLNNNIINPYIKLNSVSFMYKGHKIGIISQMNFGMKINQLTSQIPFIYFDTQIIEVEESKESYEIKLKYLEYNNEQLMLYNLPKIGEEEELNNMILDKCGLNNNKDLICQISRENIEQILGHSGQEFKIKYLDKNRGLLELLNNVMNIKINYNSIQKENVYIGLTKLLDNKISSNNYFAYETNVTNISTIITNKFVYQNIYCLMKKDPEKALIIICKYNDNGDIYVGQIKEEIKLTDINIKYNLLIQPRETEDELIILGNSGNIILANPMTLDFNLNEQLTLYYYINNVTYYNSIKLNPDSNKDLICNSKANLVTCTVYKSHFEGKNSGYYYTYHKNNFEGYSISYELSPIKVIIPSSDETVIRITNIDEKNPVKIGQKGAIAFTTDFEDKENIFDESDIETQTMKNDIPFSSDNKNYTANCHLWKPKGEKLRLICKFNENINTQKIKLNKYNFNYKQNKIALISQNDLNINQLNSNIAFLYSDNQIINITDNINEYSLSFKKEIYNREPLILYKEDNFMKNAYLNCVDGEKEIKCTITKDKLVGILSKSGEKFSLAQLTASEGIIKFDNVFDIEINYPNVVKININLTIIKLLTLTVEKNNFIVFQVNTTEVIQIFISDYFNIVPNRNDDVKCFFKKTDDEKDNKSLLLLCKADSSGEFKLDTSALNLDEINILYSFSIPETHIDETAKISNEEGPKILSVYPNSLNFTSNDKLILKYQVENPEKLTGVKLNPNSTTDLECINKNNIKECTVPKTHFTESGSYYTYYDNSLGTKSISYEISKIDVNLKKEDGNKDTDTDPGTNLGIIIGPIAGGIVLIAIIIIVVICCKRKKNDGNEIQNKIGNINSAQVELIEGDKFGDE